jgi:hypothetical protein
MQREARPEASLFESCLRIRSADDPDVDADARPRSAIVARRNGTWGREASNLSAVLVKAFKALPSDQYEDFPGSLFYTDFL